MPQPSKDFRENPQRAIYVLGRVDQQQVLRLTPDIIRLRYECSDPITVYIDSIGGETYFAENIRSLLYAPDQDTRVCRIITVVTSHAGSAAADLLALGDYAIAYKNSSIYYHGTREASGDALTTEKASSLATSLKQANELFALRLARRAFQRCIFNYGNLIGEFDEIRKGLEKGDQSDVACFAHALHKRLATPKTRMLPLEALKRQQAISALNNYVLSRLDWKQDDPWKKKEADALKLILDFELQKPHEEWWLLSIGGLAEVQEDFNQFIDYFFGNYRSHLDNIIHDLGHWLLSQEEFAEYGKFNPAQAAQREQWLKEKVESRIQPLWYFVVSLFRLLQQGEYPLAPEEAYWLGIVDEVIGSELPCPRVILESQLNLPETK